MAELEEEEEDGARVAGGGGGGGGRDSSFITRFSSRRIVSTLAPHSSRLSLPLSFTSCMEANAMIRTDAPASDADVSSFSLRDDDTRLPFRREKSKMCRSVMKIVPVSIHPTDLADEAADDAVISFFFESRPASDERENEAVDFSGVVSSDAVASGITGRAAKDDGDEDANEDDEEPPPPPPPPSLPLAPLPSGAVHSA